MSSRRKLSCFDPLHKGKAAKTPKNVLAGRSAADTRPISRAALSTRPAFGSAGSKTPTGSPGFAKELIQPRGHAGLGTDLERTQHQRPSPRGYGGGERAMAKPISQR